MVDHDVRMATQNLHIRGRGLEFQVKRDAAMLSTLSVSEGELHWRPRIGTKKRGIDTPWAEFAGWAES